MENDEEDGEFDETISAINDVITTHRMQFGGSGLNLTSRLQDALEKVNELNQINKSRMKLLKCI